MGLHWPFAVVFVACKYSSPKGLNNLIAMTPAEVELVIRRLIAVGAPKESQLQKNMSKKGL